MARPEFRGRDHPFPVGRGRRPGRRPRRRAQRARPTEAQSQQAARPLSSARTFTRLTLPRLSMPISLQVAVGNSGLSNRLRRKFDAARLRQRGERKRVAGGRDGVLVLARAVLRFRGARTRVISGRGFHDFRLLRRHLRVCGFPTFRPGPGRPPWTWLAKRPTRLSNRQSPAVNGRARGVQRLHHFLVTRHIEARKEHSMNILQIPLLAKHYSPGGLADAAPRRGCRSP